MEDQLISEEPIRFDKEDDNFRLFKKIILKNYNSTCKDQFEKGYINYCLSTFTNGYILLGSNLNGRTAKSSADKYYLRGFVLFEYEERSSTVIGKIICAIKSSNPQLRIGKKLLDSVYSFVIENRVETWTINSLPFPKLVLYYEKFGFVYQRTIYARGQPKVVVLEMNIQHEHIDEDILYSLNEVCDLDADEVEDSYDIDEFN